MAEQTTSSHNTESLQPTLNPHAKPRNLAGYIAVSIRGVIMGIADVIPGVSGGTMALILGIYEELVSSIRSFNATAIKLLLRGRFLDFAKHVNLFFLLFLVGGIAAAILSLAKLIPALLDKHPAPVHGLFFGLILASIFLVWRQIKEVSIATISLAILGAVGAYWLVGLIPFSTPDSYPFIFFCGFIAIIAMILPGISGSFVLLLLGKYAFILAALHHVAKYRSFDSNLLVILVFIAGCVVGLLSFSHVLQWLLDHYHAFTMALLAGFMVGSLRRIWPYQDYVRKTFGQKELIVEYTNVLPRSWGSEQILAIVLLFVGILIIFTMDMLVQQKDKTAT
ncbi:DUF368 domain-containing protein [Myxococcota bacterium]|nr:DUF368 domain-containing protein [Myxococcota bacterium]